MHNDMVNSFVVALQCKTNHRDNENNRCNPKEEGPDNRHGRICHHWHDESIFPWVPNYFHKVG